MHTLHGCMMAYSSNMQTHALFKGVPCAFQCMPADVAMQPAQQAGGCPDQQTAEVPLCAGLAGAWIGLTVQHCGNHGAMSTKAWVNKLMGLTDDLIGGSSLMWRYHHQVSLWAAGLSMMCGPELVTHCSRARAFPL